MDGALHASHAAATPSQTTDREKAGRETRRSNIKGSPVSAPLKILVAEDNIVQRMYLAKLIETLGYEPVCVEGGREALEQVRDNKIQIVISDYQMPCLNGIQLTQEIRKLDLDYYVYVVMITGNENDEVRGEALEAGVDDFLNKTRSPVMLNARIRAATRLIKHADELAERTRVLKESNDHIQKDLHAAAAAQRQLLPDIKKDLMGFSVASAFVPSSYVSGDMFGCFQLDDTKLAVYAVDVSGHGVHASLLSVAIGYLVTPEFFKTIVLKNPAQPDPAALVANLNTRFSAADNDEYFTMFCGVIDTTTGALDFCQAAYPSPYQIDRHGQATPVGDGGFPVGMLAEVVYENNQVTLEHGSGLVICSDAASESANADMEAFGLERLRNLVAALPDVGPKNMPNLIVRTLSEWRSGAALEDDLTVVALERRHPDDTHDTA